MPIAVMCPGCDSRLNAPDAAAGKTVKCPKCKAPMVIPEPEADPGFETVEEPVVKKKPAAPARPTVKTDVELDDDEDVTPRAKKKPRDEDDDEDVKPRAKKKPQDEDEDEDEAPRKKKGKKKPAPAALSPVMIGAIVGGVLLLGGGAFAIYWFGIREKTPEVASTGGPPFAGPKGSGPPPGIPGPKTDTPNVPTGPVKPIYEAGHAASSVYRRTSDNNLKQIGLAFHNFEASFGAFPAGICDSTGNVGLSWRVAILPFLEQEALYREFKLDEPWNSEHNKKLIPKMPKQYAAPGQSPSNGLTFYRSFTGAGTASPPPAKGRGGQPALALKLSGIPDGTSNTGLVVEAGDAVEWTKPDELVFTPSGALPRVGGIFGEGYSVLFADGRVQRVKASTPPATLKAIITAGGGEIVELE